MNTITYIICLALCLSLFWMYYSIKNAKDEKEIWPNGENED